MFEKKNGRYYLRKFGWVVDIPDDWTDVKDGLKRIFHTIDPM